MPRSTEEDTAKMYDRAAKQKTPAGCWGTATTLLLALFVLAMLLACNWTAQLNPEQLTHRKSYSLPEGMYRGRATI